jgi:four helix bundle protein
VAKHFTELACWQLSNELKMRVYEIIARPNVARDFDFCDQIRDSARSAPRNIAEGFGKYDPPEFARFLKIAKGSLTETQNHLRDGLSQAYFSQGEFHDLSLLASRARSAAIALIKYLESCPRKWRPRPACENEELP